MFRELYDAVMNPPVSILTNTNFLTYSIDNDEIALDYKSKRAVGNSLTTASFISGFKKGAAQHVLKAKVVKNGYG